MQFDELILTVMKAVNRQRTISSPFHLIKGKKSGQTIQDIGYYRLYPYFSLFPRLEKPVYDEAVQNLYMRGLLLKNDEVIHLTDRALAMPAPVTLLNGWKYRGNETLFFKRLSLIVQTFSHTRQHIKSFDPVQSAEDIQWWVKSYLMQIKFRDPGVYRSFKSELADSLSSVPVRDEQKMTLMQRLSGYGLSGLTWEQIGDAQNLSVIDAQLQLIETLHGWLDIIEKQQYPLLHRLMEGVIQQSSLTETAQRTEKLFNSGYSLEEIAGMRQLKTSTIEDHFVELAMNDPYFDYHPFITDGMYQEIVALSKRQQTKRLREIKEQLPAASYFQIRLALAIREEQT